MFIELGECCQNMLSEDFWTPNIASSQFDEYSELYSRSKSSPSYEPTIFAEHSQLCSRTNVRRPVKNGLYRYAKQAYNRVQPDLFNAELSPERYWLPYAAGLVGPFVTCIGSVRAFYFKLY